MQLPLGEPGSWLAGTALRLNALWQDGGVAGRDYAENERKAIAPSLALGLGTPTRVTVSGQFTRQDNVPDYGIPGAAWDRAADADLGADLAPGRSGELLRLAGRGLRPRPSRPA